MRQPGIPDAIAPPPGNPRFPSVDGLRAAAAIAVVLFHADQFSGANGAIGRILGHLDVGVAVFFAITGFLLYRPYFASAVGDAKRTPAVVFYWRRLLRIVPAYWLALLVLAPVLTFARPAGIGNILFLQIYRPAWVRSGIAPGWSVCVEMSFYLLLPAFAWYLQRRWGHLARAERRRIELRLIGALAVFSVALRILIHAEVHNVYMVDPLPATFTWFSGGMALAILSVEPGRAGDWLKRVATNRPWVMWGAAFVLYAATLSTHGVIESESVLVFIAYTGIAGLILAPLVLGEPRFAGARLAVTKPIAWLGLVSYGIYLYHYPLMGEIHPSGAPTVRLLVYAAFGLAIAVAAAALSYYLVERQALKLKRVTSFPRLQRLLARSS
jgi:peptidoglycan/LPS O-acetylase OafA/YrhL